ncbi:helix-turn-helix domain-containing protein [Nonomuraea sp. PA05]|uniref:helix-turn-helix domain-containing protein n=1 Tax=Nonomuraea sp. PA05 TaxID=2604466 RepID=UPI001CA30F39|nr:helix-turn-helix domain-containing protein [Nonomuraea sp. PA05]
MATLGTLLDALRPDVVQLATGDAQLAVAGVELLDAGALEPVAPQCLLLALGLNLSSPRAVRQALRLASETGGALAVKCASGLPADVAEQARTAGTTVVAVNPDIPWSRLYGLVSTLLATQPATGEPASGPAGGDLFSLANSVAAICGGAVAIMDTNQTIVAYSNLPGQPIDETRRVGILSRQVPDHALPHHLTDELWRSDSVKLIRRDGYDPRLAVVIRAGDTALGSLWATFPDEDAITDSEAVLATAAKLAALHLLTIRRHLDADQESRNAALQTALRHPGHADRALPLPASLLCLAETANPDHRPDHRTDHRPDHRAGLLRALGLLELDARSLGHEPTVSLVKDRMYVLLEAAPRGSVTVATLATHFHQRATRLLHTNLLIVRSEPVEDPDGLRQARDDLDRAISHLRDTGARPGSYAARDLHAEIVQQRLFDAVRGDPMLRTGFGGVIDAYDVRHGTAYRATLLSYLRNFGDVRAAGAELTLHENTVRKRIRRAQELFGVALDNPTHRLLLELELGAVTPGATCGDDAPV